VSVQLPVAEGNTARLLSRASLVVVSIVAAALFAWPMLSGVLGVPGGVGMTVALVGLPLLVILGSLTQDGSLRSTSVLAVVGVLSALAAAARVLSVGAGGIEFVFIVVIVAGRVLGARLGFVVGVIAVALSSLVWGGFGPWTAFQMFAVGWVAAGAGLLPHLVSGDTRRSRSLERGLLMFYGAVSSYAFGLVMNLWFWPIAVGPGTSVSFSEGAGFVDNATRFLVYSLATSTLTWDTVRAITTVVGLAIVATPALRALRRVHQRLPYTE
jgi:energy-coupling factor transport system substrate-specific component